MFAERLSELKARIGDAEAVSLVSADGLTVEAVRDGSELDLELLTAEIVGQVEAIAENHRELAAGDLRQLTVVTDRMTVMVSSVSDSYYLVLVLSGEGNRGRARFELRRARLLLEGDLA